MEPIKKLFEKEIFSYLQQKKKEVDFYQNLIEKNLDKDLISSFKVVKLDKKTIHLSVFSNVLAHKLKLLSRQIIKDINKELGEKNKIRNLKIKILIKNIPIKNQGSNLPNNAIQKFATLSKKLKTSPLRSHIRKIITKAND
tara:strand:+ start:534 stop:956 length:423 start_codon:yes stop_codon:yes gene_type:complete